MPEAFADHDLRTSAAHVLLADASGVDIAHVTIDDDVEHHLRRVLRLRDGEQVSVTDGAGQWRMCVVVVSGARCSLEATGEIVSVAEPERFTIASAIPKGDRVDWLVQKVTELGADRVLLLHTERSSVRWTPDRAEKQITRLQRIADEALRQSRRVWRCTVEGPVDAADVLGEAAIAEPGGFPISGAESMIAIGPEGGWTEDEVKGARTQVSMGPNILRTETAGVAATTLRMVADHGELSC